MLIIYHDIYRRKCRSFVNFRFSNFDGHFKGQNFKTHLSRCVCLDIFRKFGKKKIFMISDQSIEEGWLKKKERHCN